MSGEERLNRIPQYAMQDVWCSLGNESSEFGPYYEHHGYATTWGHLLKAVNVWVCNAKKAEDLLEDETEATAEFIRQRDVAEKERDEALSEAERLNECHADTVAVGKDLYHRYVQEIFRSHIWRKAAKNFRRQRDEARAEAARLTKERDAMRSLYQEAMDRLGKACRDVQKHKARHHRYRTAFSEMVERVARVERSLPDEESGGQD